MSKEKPETITPENITPYKPKTKKILQNGMKFVKEKDGPEE